MALMQLSELEQLQQLIRRDRQRKLLALLLVSGVTGVAVYAQAVWLLAVLATGLAGGKAWQKAAAARRNQLQPPGTIGE